jgi:eukaryotic-like serine/threonine-protein kinase
MSRYELAERLGVGATATVWRARDRRSGRNVCVKRLHPRLATDVGARDRLRQEAELATRVAHPAIPDVVDAHVASDAPALVFPYLEGESLAVRLKRDGALPPAEAARIAARVAEALAAVHAAGVVHRDVKPSNILLGDNGEVRLLDFGIAEQTGTAATNDTGRQTTVGTLPYVGPQQLAGLPAAPSDDVWALGAVLYEMLSGRPPYEAHTAPDLANAQAAAPPDLTDVPLPLARAALSALATDPAARPPAAAVATTLDSWLTAGSDPDSPTVAMTAAIPVAQPPRRRVGLGSALALAAAVVVGLAVTSALAFGPDWLPAGAVPPASDSPAPINQPAFVPPLMPSPDRTVEPTTEPTATPAPRQASQPSGGSGSKPKADNSKPKNPGNSGGKGKGKKKGQR